MATQAQKTKKLYNLIGKAYNDAFPFHFHPEHLKLFLDALSLGSRILDAGCAGGRDTNYFRQQGFDVVGLDFSTVEIDYAKNKYPNVQFVVGDILEMSKIFPRASFDGVYTYATLDHLKKVIFLKRLKNVIVY